MGNKAICALSGHSPDDEDPIVTGGTGGIEGDEGDEEEEVVMTAHQRSMAELRRKEDARVQKAVRRLKAQMAAGLYKMPTATFRPLRIPPPRPEVVLEREFVITHAGARNATVNVVVKDEFQRLTLKEMLKDHVHQKTNLGSPTKGVWFVLESDEEEEEIAPPPPKNPKHFKMVVTMQ